ncbi:MAG: hypothetical protein ACE5I1_09480 [bacterium]
MQRNLTQREKFFIAAMGILLAIYLLNLFAISPLRSDWQETNMAWESAQVNFASALKMARIAEQVRLHQTTADSASANTQLATFLREIEAAAGSQITIRRFQPLQRTVGSGRRTKNNAALPKMIRHQVQIDCSGTLANLMAFIQKIEAKNQLTRVRQIYLSPDRNRQNQLQCQLILVRLVPG